MGAIKDIPKSIKVETSIVRNKIRFLISQGMIATVIWCVIYGDEENSKTNDQRFEEISHFSYIWKKHLQNIEFADLRFSFLSSEDGSLSPTVFLYQRFL